MRIVFPDGAGCVQHPSDLEPLRKLGEVDFYDGVPADRAQLIERLRPAPRVLHVHRLPGGCRAGRLARFDRAAFLPWKEG